MSKQPAPFRTAAVTVAGSVHEDDLPTVRSHTEERQSLGAALGKNLLLSATTKTGSLAVLQSLKAIRISVPRPVEGSLSSIVPFGY